MPVRAIVLPAPNQEPEIRVFSDPQLQDGEVLLETIATEVCGTDVHLLHGQLAGVPYPIIPGHISTGRVLQVQGIVRTVEDEQVIPGDIVTFLDVHRTCGHCWYCQVAKASTRCPERRVYGVTYSATEGLLGGWSERIVLLAGVHILKLPPTLVPATFMAVGCGLPTALHAVQRGEITFGDTVVVLGAGPVGLCCTVLAQLQGATQVIVIGGPAHRLSLARTFGADVTLDIAEHTPEERVRIVRDATSGRGADVTIEATGVASAVAEGFQFTRNAGTLVVVGQYTDAGPITLNPHRAINQPHLQVRGCWGSDLGHLYRGLRIMTRYANHYPWQEMITSYHTLEDAASALSIAERQQSIKALILPNGTL